MAARTVVLVLLIVLIPAAALAQPEKTARGEQPATASLVPPGMTTASAPIAGLDPNTMLDAATPDQPQKHESRWYGDQILFANGLGVGLVALGATMQSEEVLILGVLGTFLGSPIVHLANQEAGNFLLSIPLHIALPIGGAAIGVHTLEFCNECHGPNFEGMLLGAALGVAAATIIDAAFLARTRPKRGKSSTPAWAPRLGVTGNGFSAGIGGTF